MVTEFTDILKIHLYKALETDPKFSEAHFQLALLYKDNGDEGKAEIHFNKAIELDSEQSREINKRGENLLKKYQFQNANMMFLKAQKKRHHCARVNLQLSNLYKNQSEVTKAETCLLNSIQLDPTSSKAHRNMGILLIQQKNYDDARFYFEKALDLNYNDFLAHLNLGLIMKQCKDYLAAKLHFLTALDINPNFSVCMLEIALLQLVMKNHIKAKIYYQKAREISPDISHAELDTILR